MKQFAITPTYFISYTNPSIISCYCAKEHFKILAIKNYLLIRMMRHKGFMIKIV